jgi:signal transduction histidine kinase
MLGGLTRRKLRGWLALFFLALALPTAVLIAEAFDELKWEAIYRHRLLAEELAGRIDNRLKVLVGQEGRRSFADYAFLNVAGDLLQRSPLSAYPVASPVPGLVGYFQVDTDGAFSTPLAPADGGAMTRYGVPEPEWRQRLNLARSIQRILSQNQLVQAESKDEEQKQGASEPLKERAVGELEAATVPPAGQPEAQAAFDLLNTPTQAAKKKQALTSKLGRVMDLKLDDSYQSKQAEKDQTRTDKDQTRTDKDTAARREKGVLPESPPAPAPASALHEPQLSGLSELRVRTFESEIDPFEFSLLDSGHFVLFRKVWRDGQRYIQGALIAARPFLDGIIDAAFRETLLSRTSDLIAAYRGDIIAAYGGVDSRAYLSSTSELTGTLLYQTRLSAPLGELDLIFSVRQLPIAPGGRLITWIGLVLVVVLCGGFYVVYRVGLRQIALVEQQQDFVSAVSHELKTPLTSIRMYGEMLREGWAPEDKKATYYGFIHDESDRLSRLISNILQISRMTRNDVRPDLKRLAVSELLDGLRSKITSQVERAGFTLNLTCEEAVEATVLAVDADFFAQIMINLVDNATKFARKADVKTIDIAWRQHSDGAVVVTVRDYGPGIPKDQMKKIFMLFYRAGTELTRETVGTGIGLALVRQLAAAMNAEVDAVNKDPGAAFSLRMLPARKA